MNDDAPTDKELIGRCRQGDNPAFEMLYARYRLQLYSYLNRLVPQRSHVADDLFQQTWINALEHLDHYTDQQKFMSWLFRIAHNLAIDHIRRESRAPMVELTESSAVDESDPGNALDEEVLKQAVETAAAELPPAQREVLTLRQQGVSFKDIAGIQGASINTVLGRMHYAVNRLRKQLADYA